MHSLFHLTVGLLGITAYLYSAWSRSYIRGFAIAPSILTVMVTVVRVGDRVRPGTLFGHDVWLHDVEAAAAFYIGFVMPESISTPVEARTIMVAE